MEKEITFAQLGIPQEILLALEDKGYGYPTRVQELAIPPMMEGKDILAKAPTGTGKTYAFGIPMITQIDRSSDAVQGLVLAPTRELALQIGDELRSLLTHVEGIRVAVLYGGQKFEPQLKQLRRKPQIVVATPGRLMDHYRNRNIRLDSVKTVVLDEADRMLDMGFYKDVTGILDKLKNKQCMGLFSATISQEVMTVSWMYQRDEVEITVKPEAESRPDIDQFSISTSALEKEETTLRLLRLKGFERVIIFCNTKHMCQSLSDDLKRAGLDADCLHGDIPQAKREKTMQTFKAGKLGILVATDVASRGIDVDDVDAVINYDIPEENEYYIHRIGRTARAGKNGSAWSILGSFPERAKLEEIAKYSHFDVKAMRFSESGELEDEPIRVVQPVSRRRRR
ncbi:MAG: DEAD/DEAH box helicase [Oscillospiraceae bacterium]|nr:DEAD/DEAH box helicase [Oscillospiraceae bacterium]